MPPVFQEKTIVITGANGGIGAAAVRMLCEQGHRVVTIDRPGTDSDFTADFARLDDVRALATALTTELPRIDVLANNAGGMFDPHARTADGHSLTLQVDYLAPFLLTTLLLPKLEASAATIAQTASTAARYFGRLDPHQLDSPDAASARSPFTAYGEAKLALILFTRELHRRHPRTNPVAFHPGVVASGFGQQSGSWIRHVYGTWLARATMRSPARGGGELAWFAGGEPGRDWMPGEYYERRRPGRIRGSELAAALWDRTTELLA
jgi:NAD(P)-dependent dehydrogenase (short-subunit alcohol dehydrogenase family)